MYENQGFYNFEKSDNSVEGLFSQLLTPSQKLTMRSPSRAGRIVCNIAEILL